MDTKQQIAALEALVIDNPQLDELESLIAEFNIFEAMGAVRQELRHSDFLAFLLAPSEKHGLDDLFLKRFLIRVLSAADDPPITPITINVTDLSNATVERESQNIDILIHDSDSGLVCVIENKVFSGEHSNQLDRYLQIAKRRFTNAKAIIPVYLTPDGIPPSNENSPYIPYSYSQISEIIEHVREAQQSMLGADVNTMLRHYVTMLRRYIVSESDVAELCRQIYRTHKTAIDLILEHIPDLRQELADYLVALIDNTPSFTKVRYTKSYIDFMSQDWQKVAEFNAGIGWANSTATMAFEFANAPDRLTLYLILGPLQSEHQYVRESIFAHADANREIFKGCRRNLTEKWATIYKMPFLRPRDYEDASLEDLIQIIESKWEHFVENELPTLNKHLMQIELN